MTETFNTTDPTVRELPLAAGGDLELRLGANRLRVRVTDTDRVVIRGRTDHDLERDVEITSGVGWVRVTDGPVGSLRVGPITVRSGGHTPDLDVEVPRNVRISARTLSGSIDAFGVAGPSRWQSASGDVRIGADAGPLTVETMSGDVLVEARAPLAITARTVSGSVWIRGPRVTVLDVATTSGDVVIDAALDDGARHSVTSVSGELRLFTDSEVTVDLQSVTGDIRASLPHRVEGARGRRTVAVGSGRVRVDVRTMSGDVALRPGSPDGAPAGGPGTTNDRATSAGAAGSGARPSFWAEFARDWAESAKDWASWGASWAAGRSWASPEGPGADASSAAGTPGASAPTTEVEADRDRPAPSAPAAAGPEPPAAKREPDAPTDQASAANPELDDTAPVSAPGGTDIEAARLEVLRSLERGELDVAAAADRLAALEDAARRAEA